MKPDPIVTHGQSEGIKILVIDDDAPLRNVMQRTLEAAGYGVVTAANGKQGLREFLTARFDMVIVDIFMPEQDGFEVLTELRRTSRQVKVLVISGGGTLGLREALLWAQQLRVRHTLRKPFTREELLGAIEQVLSGP